MIKEYNSVNCKDDQETILSSLMIHLVYAKYGAVLLTPAMKELIAYNLSPLPNNVL